MKSININPNIITRISAVDKEVIYNFKYIEEKIESSFWGLIKKITPAHYKLYNADNECELSDAFYSLEDIQNATKKVSNSILIQKDSNYVIYKKPCVIITTIDGKDSISFFSYKETFEEAMNYKDDLSVENNLTCQIDT